jgi:hypothetical protein
MNHDFDDLLDEAIDNIRNDRKLAREFLNEIATQIAKDPDNNRALSPVAAKHIETMQQRTASESNKSQTKGEIERSWII